MKKDMNKLTKYEINFIRKNEEVIKSILEKRIDELKDEILEVPEEKRENLINFIKEYKFGLGFLKELASDKKSNYFTGI